MLLIDLNKNHTADVIKRELFVLHEHPGLYGVRVAHIFSYLWCGFLFCLYSFYVLCSLLPVRLDSLFSITPSIFSNAYL